MLVIIDRRTLEELSSTCYDPSGLSNVLYSISKNKPESSFMSWGPSTVKMQTTPRSISRLSAVRTSAPTM